MSKLNIFVDESGDFGEYRQHSPYYIVALVMHDPLNDISKEIYKLNILLKDMGYEEHVIHTEPLIRREDDYQNLTPNERRSILTKLYYFTLKCNIQYKTFTFRKKDFKNSSHLEKQMIKEISFFIRNNISYFQKYEKIVLHYDNGQHELNRILNIALSNELTHFKIKKVLPCNYKLFQSADLICTLELLRLKTESGNLTHSETFIFHSKKELRKDFLKGISKKSFRKK